MPAFRIQAFNGVRPYDGAPLLLVCDKEKGLTLFSIRGFKNKEELNRDPTGAALHKIADTPFSDLTGRPLGTWEVNVRHKGGVTSFRMRNKADALGLISWIEKRERRRAKGKPGAAEQAQAAAGGGPCAMKAITSADEHRAYLANLCYRLSYLRGRQSVREVDAELSAIVDEIQGVLRVK